MLQISLPRFISQEWIFQGFPWLTKVTRRDREGVSRRCAVSAVDYVACHAPKKEGAHYFGTAVKNLPNIRTQTNKEILE